jgi:hypothetical protein
LRYGDVTEYYLVASFSLHPSTLDDGDEALPSAARFHVPETEPHEY